MADDFSDISALLQQTADEARKKKEETSGDSEVEDIFSEWDFSKDSEESSEMDDDVVPFGDALSAFKKKQKKQIPYSVKVAFVASIAGIIGLWIYYSFLMPLIYKRMMVNVEADIARGEVQESAKLFNLASVFKFDYENELGEYIYQLLKYKQFPSAKKNIDKILYLYEDSEIGLDSLAKYYIATDKLNLAEESIQQYIIAHKESYKLNFNKGEIAYKKGKIDEAVKFYTNSYLMKSDYHDPFVRLRQIFVENKNYKKVIEMQNYIDALLSPPPPDYITYLHLGTAYYYMAYESDVSVTIQKNMLKLSQSYFEKCIAANPNEPIPYWMLGQINEYFYNFDNALKNYSEYLRLKPNDANAYAALGIIHYKNNNLKEAVKNLQKAVKMDPTLVKAHYYIGNLFMYEFDNYPNAISEYLIVLNSNEKQKDLLFHLAGAYFKNKEFKNSIKYYNDYLIKYKGDLDSYNNLALAHVHFKEPKQALKYYKLYLKSARENADIYNNMGVCHEILNEERFAIRYYWKAMAILEQEDAIKDGLLPQMNFKRFMSKDSYKEIEDVIALNIKTKPIR